jgi:hypothetical protein
MKRKTATFALIISSLCTAACSSLQISRQDQCVSVDRALSEINDTNGTQIAVCGFLKYEFEDKNLYVSKRDANQQLFRNCISLGKASDYSGDLEKLNGKWVRVTGLATSKICPADSICQAACSDSGVYVRTVETIPKP